MESLLSLPWNIEVMLSRDSTPTSGLQLRLDTFVDALLEEDSPSAAAAPGATKIVSRAARACVEKYTSKHLTAHDCFFCDKCGYTKGGLDGSFHKVSDNTRY